MQKWKMIDPLTEEGPLKFAFYLILAKSEQVSRFAQHTASQSNLTRGHFYTATATAINIYATVELIRHLIMPLFVK